MPVIVQSDFLLSFLLFPYPLCVCKLFHWFVLAWLISYPITNRVFPSVNPYAKVLLYFPATMLAGFHFLSVSLSGENQQEQ
jgi:hypothetical protein